MKQTPALALLSALDGIDEVYLAEAVAQAPRVRRFAARHAALIAAAVLALAVMLAMPMLRSGSPLPPPPPDRTAPGVSDTTAPPPPETTQPLPPDSDTAASPQTTTPSSAESSTQVVEATGVEATGGDVTTQTPPRPSTTTTTARPMGGGDNGGPDDILFCVKRMDSIDGNYLDLVDHNTFFEWAYNLRAVYENRPLSSLHEYANLYSFIHHFAIPQEVMLQKSRDLQARYADTKFADLFMTPEEIEMLYTADEAEIIAYFLRDNAIYHNGMLFNAKWIHTHTEADYRTWGLPAEDVARVKAAAAGTADPQPAGTSMPTPTGTTVLPVPITTVLPVTTVAPEPALPVPVTTAAPEPALPVPVTTAAPEPALWVP